MLGLPILWFVATAAPLKAATIERPADVRLLLTAEQLDTVGNRGQLPLTRQQTKRVFAVTGKKVPYVFVTYVQPDGELGELGYNLALRDRPDSILLLGMYVLDKSKIAAKEADDQAMIGQPKKPGKEYRSVVYDSFLIDSQGRIWTWMDVSDFAKYARPHQGSFGMVYINPASPKDASSLAYQDTLRYMKLHLKKAGAAVWAEGK